MELHAHNAITGNAAIQLLHRRQRLVQYELLCTSLAKCDRIDGLEVGWIWEKRHLEAMTIRVMQSGRGGYKWYEDVLSQGRGDAAY